MILKGKNDSEMSHFRIQLISDVHLEFRESFSIEPLAENLALCGDIGYPYHARYFKFLQENSQKFKRIFLITGNHEYYGKEIGKIHQQIQTVVADLPNVYFLNNSSILLEHEGQPFQVFGSTLWTMIMNNRFEIAQTINDYAKIRIKDGQNYRKISIGDVNLFHIKAITALREALKLNIPTIVLTHHLPSFECIHPDFLESNLNEAYASNLEIYIKPPIKLWLFGHTHKFTNKEINGVRLAANPLGYPMDATDYKPRVFSGSLTNEEPWILE